MSWWLFGFIVQFVALPGYIIAWAMALNKKRYNYFQRRKLYVLTGVLFTTNLVLSVGRVIF